MRITEQKQDFKKMGSFKMANLEENLKKINEELEMLDDNELENVAGGVLPV